MAACPHLLTLCPVRKGASSPVGFIFHGIGGTTRRPSTHCTLLHINMPKHINLENRINSGVWRLLMVNHPLSGCELRNDCFMPVFLLFSDGFSDCFLTVFLTVFWLFFWQFFWLFSACFLSVFWRFFGLFSDSFSDCFLTVFWLFSCGYLSYERGFFSFHVHKLGTQMLTTVLSGYQAEVVLDDETPSSGPSYPVLACCVISSIWKHTNSGFRWFLTNWPLLNKSFFERNIQAETVAFLVHFFKDFL